MKRTMIVAALAATALLAGSCKFIKVTDAHLLKMHELEASGKQVDSVFTVDAFDAIWSDVPADIFYEFGTECTVVASGPDNIMEKLVVANVGSALHIHMDEDLRLGENKLTVVVTSPVLSTVKINGAGDFTSRLGFSAQEFEVDVKGAGDVEIEKLVARNVDVSVKGAGDIELGNIECEMLRIDISGAGDAVVSGKAGSAELSIKGAGDIDIRELSVGSVQSNVSGVGAIRRKK